MLIPDLGTPQSIARGQYCNNGVVASVYFKICLTWSDKCIHIPSQDKELLLSLEVVEKAEGIVYVFGLLSWLGIDLLLF